MPVDLEQARVIGRRVLDATMLEPADWSCAHGWYELPGQWVLFVEWVGAPPPPDPLPREAMDPIVVAMADGSVTRTMPFAEVMAAPPAGEDRFRAQLAAWLTQRYTPSQLQTIAGMRHLRLFAPNGRDWRSDSLRFAVRITDPARFSETERLLGYEGGTGRGWAPVTGTLDGHPAGIEWAARHLVVDIAPAGGNSSLLSDGDLAFAALLDARLDGLGVELDLSYAMASWVGMIDPAAFPEVFSPPPPGAL